MSSSLYNGKTQQCCPLFKLKDISADVSLATSEIPDIDILLRSFLIILGVSLNQLKLQRGKAELLSHGHNSEWK